jgi:hypothetical protein
MRKSKDEKIPEKLLKIPGPTRLRHVHGLSKTPEIDRKKQK